MSLGSLRAATENGAFRRPNSEREKALGVCHIASGDLWAGAEVQVAALMKYLAREPRLRLSAIILNHGRLADEIGRLDLPTIIIPEREKGFLEIVRSGSRFLEGLDVRIIHSHRYKEHLLASRLARRLGIPHLVRTDHGLPEPRRGLRSLKQRFIHSLDARVARRSANAAIGVSAEMTRHLARRLDPRKVVAIPNGLDLEGVRCTITPQRARELLRLPPEVLVIGTAGRLEHVKRLDIFLKSSVEIAAKRPDARFVIAGDGNERGALVSMAKALGVFDRVLFLGHCDGIYEVLRAFDAFVLCSDHEGLPMVLLEALWLGVPVVARAVGGIPEVIQSGENGILVESSDPRILAQACLRVVSSRAARERLIKEGIRTVERDYSAAQTAFRVAELYLSIAQKS